MQVELEYRFGPRSILRPGDRFRTSGGPYYEGSRRIAMTAKGPFTFKRFCWNGDGEWIEALDRDGARCVLRLTAGPDLGCRLVNRPYVVTSKIRT